MVISMVVQHVVAMVKWNVVGARSSLKMKCALYMTPSSFFGGGLFLLPQAKNSPHPKPKVPKKERGFIFCVVGVHGGSLCR